MPDSRQSAFAELKTRAFAHLSAQHPTASRKHRRAAARLAARGLVAEFRAVHPALVDSSACVVERDPYASVDVSAAEWDSPQWAEVRAAYARGECAEAAALEASRPRPA
jgi:hypothetical protein